MSKYRLRVYLVLSGFSLYFRPLVKKTRALKIIEARGLSFYFSFLFCFVLFCFVLFLLYFTLLYFSFLVLFCFVLFCFVLFCSVLFCSVLFFSSSLLSSFLLFFLTLSIYISLCFSPSLYSFLFPSFYIFLCFSTFFLYFSLIFSFPRLLPLKAALRQAYSIPSPFRLRTLSKKRKSLL